MSPSSAPTQLAVLRPAVNYGLRTAQRHITTVDAARGQSVFAPQEDLLYCDRGGYSVSWNYATSAFPNDLTDNKDLQGFLSHDVDTHSNSVLYTGSRIVNGRGITFNTTNFAPGTETVMHRTLSVDFVTIVEGTMELELDSGEKVMLQAGTNHLWRNPSPDKPARMVSVITPAHGVTVNGQTLAEEGFSMSEMGKPGST